MEDDQTEREDRLVAAMLLRDARARAEQAGEEGIYAFLRKDTGVAPKVNERLLRGEISQVQSHNQRCGIEPLPPQQASASGFRFGSSVKNRLRATAAELEAEFFRAAHQMREGVSADSQEPLSKKPRGGNDKCFTKGAGTSSREIWLPPNGSARSGDSTKAARYEADIFWPVRGMRVRIVDEDGNGFQKYHLKKAVVDRRYSAKRLVDLRLDDANEIVESVPVECLETVVSKTCSKVEVVRGRYMGLNAQLVEKTRRLNQAVVKLVDEGEVVKVTLPLDDICEFA